jgi:hypothetical protein
LRAAQSAVVARLAKRDGFDTSVRAKRYGISNDVRGGESA